jgi:hypothetical protein
MDCSRLSPGVLAAVRAVARQWWLVVAGVVVAAVLLGTATSKASGHHLRPVLGSSGAAPHGKGFGTVKPQRVYLGGDPTGEVTQLQWSGWGHRTAIGSGIGFFAPPGKSVAQGVSVPAQLHLSSLGKCKGRIAYRRMNFSFTYKGRTHPGAKLGICGGLTYRN